METEIVCPLGAECEKAVDGKIQRCAWYVKLQGKNPQSGKDVDESRCAMAWQPLLMIESNGAIHNTAASIQSLRNETCNNQKKAMELINGKEVTQDKRLR